MLSHINEDQNPTMVDVSNKTSTHRIAKACSIVRLPKAISDLGSKGEILTKKGPVFQTAIIAGTMAAKKTSELIPLCHTLSLESCTIDISLQSPNKALITCTVSTQHKTGVEMEALVGATTAALTIYDMCKALSHDIVIEETRLIEKRGGKNGDFIAL